MHSHFGLDGHIVFEYISIIKIGFDTIKSGVDALKNLIPFLSGNSATYARAQIDFNRSKACYMDAQTAREFGYPLCKAHLPPIPMLKNRVHPKYIEDIYKCPVCGCEQPPPEYFEKVEREKAVFDIFI